jgi:hypothetical protein
MAWGVNFIGRRVFDPAKDGLAFVIIIGSHPPTCAGRPTFVVHIGNQVQRACKKTPVQPIFLRSEKAQP